METHEIVVRFELLEHAQSRPSDLNERLIPDRIVLYHSDESLGDYVVVACLTFLSLERYGL